MRTMDIRGAPLGEAGLQGATLFGAYRLLPWLLLGLLLVALLILFLYLALTRGAKLRALDKKLAAARKMLQDRAAALAEAEGKAQNSEGLLISGLGPMLQVVHELRAPIAAVQSCLDVILQGYGTGDTVLHQEMLHLARDRAGALLALVNDLLNLGTVGRPEAAKEVHLIQLGDVLWHIGPEMSIKAMLRGVDLRLDVANSLPLIIATEEHIKQLLSNLIDNAIKYTNPEGTVTVSLREGVDGVIGEVRDTGIGIAPEDVDRICEVFYRAKNAREVEPYGTGLGLPIAKRVVELYGGQLHIESGLGKGSRFTFSFPKMHIRYLPPTQAVASEAFDNQEKADWGSTTIGETNSHAGSEGHGMSKEVAHSKECVVIGGGVAGTQVALDLADMGVKVHLVEKGPSIGGRMAQLDKIFPVNCHGGCRHCSISLVSHEFGDCLAHPNITLHDYTEVKEVTGSAGNYQVRALKHARFVDPDKCTLCGNCAEVCPISLPDEFNEGLSERRAIYLPHAQAVPNAYLISKRGTAPCTAACPGNISAQGYISLIAQGRYEEALEVIREYNPFPGTVARVCDHPCEGECPRGTLDEPVAICDLEGFVADWVYAKKEGQSTADAAPSPGISEDTKRVAIVGAGPAGLSAVYFLARMGYRVTLFEALSKPGGMMLRIPAKRLPQDVLQREIDDILALGVELRLESPVSDIDGLLAEGYEAVFLAPGVHEPQSLTLSGETIQQSDLAVDSETLQTSSPGVFAGGHAARGPEFLIRAIADGRRAASSIDRYLRGVPLIATNERQSQPVAHLTDEEVAELFHSKEVNQGPREVGADAQEMQGLTEEQARAEALRCLRCGICSECGLCVTVCDPDCIDLQMPAEVVELNVGAIIVATGLEPFDPSGLAQLGYGRYKNVVTSLEYERLIGASGPTGGHLRRPSDGRPVKRLGFIQCVGSRDVNHNRYCSSVCCMFATQEAIVANEHDPEVHSTIFYIDLRAGGKGFQECVDQAQNENNVAYLRARVAEITEDADASPVIQYENTLSGKAGSETVDLAVLVTGLRPRHDVKELADLLAIDVDEYHFIETDPFSPMKTSREGIFACGFCCGPADISESVIQGSGAAAQAAELVLRD